LQLVNPGTVMNWWLGFGSQGQRSRSPSWTLVSWEFARLVECGCRSGRLWNRLTTGWWSWQRRRTTTWRRCFARIIRTSASHRSQSVRDSGQNVWRPRLSTSPSVNIASPVWCYTMLLFMSYVKEIIKLKI